MTESSGLPASEPDRPHKPADDTEEVYYEGSPLLRGNLGRLFLCWLIGLIIMAVPLIWYLFQAQWLWWWAILGCLAVGLIIIFVPTLTARTKRYRISNYRIDFERGLLSRNIDTLELWHVEDISFHQSLIDRMLKVGTITVISHDETNPKLELHGIPNPRPLFDSLKQRIIAVKRQRGVIKVDQG
ncbi:MAG TPA: PH domain-containing protein [Tepidisphaeraceae bacterium]|nr:PH domain-containing protein [Tepidisphaeraceae bacterium]